eukprot:scaffold156_cov308-Prasinococcus_capsulatus_cf.AAC.15
MDVRACARACVQRVAEAPSSACRRRRDGAEAGREGQKGGRSGPPGAPFRAPGALFGASAGAGRGGAGEGANCGPGRPATTPSRRRLARSRGRRF